jgi:hypothetical protein
VLDTKLRVLKTEGSQGLVTPAAGAEGAHRQKLTSSVSGLSLLLGAQPPFLT